MTNKNFIHKKIIIINFPLNLNLSFLLSKKIKEEKYPITFSRKLASGLDAIDFILSSLLKLI